MVLDKQNPNKEFKKDYLHSSIMPARDKTYIHRINLCSRVGYDSRKHLLNGAVIIMIRVNKYLKKSMMV